MKFKTQMQRHVHLMQTGALTLLMSLMIISGVKYHSAKNTERKIEPKISIANSAFHLPLGTSPLTAQNRPGLVRSGPGRRHGIGGANSRIAKLLIFPKPPMIEGMVAKIGELLNEQELGYRGSEDCGIVQWLGLRECATDQSLSEQ